MTTTQSSAPRTILITGSTSGMGHALALELARANPAHTLLLHGRDATRLAAVTAEVRGLGAEARGYLADLADLDQVHDLADRITDAEPRLDVLVNNAVVVTSAQPKVRQLSVQGHDLLLAVNYLAPYALTRGLLPLLSASAAAPATHTTGEVSEPVTAPSRVVNVASMGQSPIDFTDVMMEREYDALEAYCRSKLALIMSSFDLAAELTAAGQRVTVNALHPAHLMDTPGVRALHTYGLEPAVGVEEGVRPTVRLITDPALAEVTGRYFDQFTDSPAHEQAYDRAAREQLAELTQRLTSRR